MSLLRMAQLISLNIADEQEAIDAYEYALQELKSNKDVPQYSRIYRTLVYIKGQEVEHKQSLEKMLKDLTR